MTRCKSCDLFVDSRNMIPLLGVVCSRCAAALSQPTHENGGVVNKSMVELGELYQREFADRRDAFVRRCRDVVKYRQGIESEGA